MAAALVGCGDRRGGAGPPTVPQGGGSGGAGAMGGASGVGSGGAGGSVATGGSAGSVACQGFEVTGTLDGQAVDTLLASGPLVDSGSMGASWKYQVLLEHGSLVSLRGKAATTPTDGMPVTGTAYLATPADSALGGVHLVVQQASMKYMDAQQPIVLGGLARVGACGDKPVQGSLDVCVPNSPSACGGKGVRVQGTLDGAAIDESHSENGWFWVGASTEVARADIGADGEVWVHDFGGTLSGFVKLPTASSRPKLVLCAASATRKSTSDARELTLSSLSEVGAMPGNAVTGELQLVRCP